MNLIPVICIQSEINFRIFEFETFFDFNNRNFEGRQWTTMIGSKQY